MRNKNKLKTLLKIGLMVYIANSLRDNAGWVAHQINNQVASVFVFFALAGAVALAFFLLFEQE
jgi:hypothetical protein